MAETDTTVDTTQQATSKVPTYHVKNPKRVAAGKANYKKRREAQEAQKKKIAEADVIVANEQLRKAQEEAKKVDEYPPETALPETAPPETSPTETSPTEMTKVSQWLSGISIGLSLLGLYYKRNEIKNALTKIKASLSANAQTAPASAIERMPPASANASANAQTAPVPDKKTPKKVGIQTMA